MTETRTIEESLSEVLGSYDLRYEYEQADTTDESGGEISVWVEDSDGEEQAYIWNVSFEVHNRFDTVVLDAGLDDTRLVVESCFGLNCDIDVDLAVLDAMDVHIVNTVRMALLEKFMDGWAERQRGEDEKVRVEAPEEERPSYIIDTADGDELDLNDYDAVKARWEDIKDNELCDATCECDACKELRTVRLRMKGIRVA